MERETGGGHTLQNIQSLLATLAPSYHFLLAQSNTASYVSKLACLDPMPIQLVSERPLVVDRAITMPCHHPRKRCSRLICRTVWQLQTPAANSDRNVTFRWNLLFDGKPSADVPPQLATSPLQCEARGGSFSFISP